MADQVTVKIHSEKVEKMLIRIGKKLGTMPTEVKEAIAQYWVRAINQTFEKEGARGGLAKWPRRKYGTMVTPAGTWRLAYGLDQYPRRNKQQLAEHRSAIMSAGKWRWGQTGPMPGYQGDRRYNKCPKVLQISGTLKRLSTQVKYYKRKVRVGAPKIIADARGKLLLTQEIVKGRPIVSATVHDKHMMVKTVLKAIRTAAKDA